MSHQRKTDLPIGILAGGKSLRFGAGDKSTALLGSARIIDHLLDRLTGQTAEIVISGAGDFGLNLPFVRDDPNAVNGPVAGLFALANHFRDSDSFLTVAADMPFIPLDYAARLKATGPTAIASVAGQLHPTCGIWRPSDIINAVQHLDPKAKASLLSIAISCEYSSCEFGDKDGFMNINTPQDLAAAKRKLESDHG